MTTQQIYTILNEVSAQTLGSSALSVVDTGSFIALGDAVLSSNSNTEQFTNTLVQRIGKTVLVNRAYRSRYRKLIKGEMEFGAIMQKVSVDMPEVSEDASLPLVDGQSVDQYVVKKPKVHQWLFVQDSTYMIWVTIQERWLRQAFLNESAMSGFISMIFQKVQNKLELCIENLCRMAMNNYAALAKPQQTVDLVSRFNAESGENIPVGMTAMFNKDFLAWCSGTIREIGRNLESISVLYNYEGEERFSPTEFQNLAILSKFQTQLETVALSTAFHDDYLKIVDNFLVPYWQSPGNTDILDFESRSKISVRVRKFGEEELTPVTIENVVGMIFDNDALGAFRKWQSTRTTPMNAKGLYANTYWHEDQMWFNALDENFILLTLN